MTPTLAVDVLPDIRATLDAGSAALWTIARSRFPESANAAKEEINNALAALAALESRRCATCRHFAVRTHGMLTAWDCTALNITVIPSFGCNAWTAAEAEGVTE